MENQQLLPCDTNASPPDTDTDCQECVRASAKPCHGSDRLALPVPIRSATQPRQGRLWLLLQGRGQTAVSYFLDCCPHFGAHLLPRISPRWIAKKSLISPVQLRNELRRFMRQPFAIVSGAPFHLVQKLHTLINGQFQNGRK